MEAVKGNANGKTIKTLNRRKKNKKKKKNIGGKIKNNLICNVFFQTTKSMVTLLLTNKEINHSFVQLHTKRKHPKLMEKKITVTEFKTLLS